jgi:hypothetical protein
MQLKIKESMHQMELTYHCKKGNSWTIIAMRKAWIRRER